MLWLLAFHLIVMVCWFAGLFYLPRLFVYHAQSSDAISLSRFKKMERNLFFYIMTPAGVLTTLSGIALLGLHYAYYFKQGWMMAKLLFVAMLWLYHFYCGKLLHAFKQDQRHPSAKFFRFFNEIPTLLLFIIIILVVVKP
ncbi:MAG: TIGR00701 family protein [Coxiella sp. RIFCSPHIGHO2_12_FULL_42_15]|nr:MAG: TIGR00701 family protein [Coxiella sp. RIFCSPHIGHO2_12_FULL_42_15]